MIKAVLLDVDDTLLDFDLGAREAATEAFKEAGLTYGDDVHRAFTRINNDLWRSVEKGLMTREELYKIRWQTILDSLGIKADGEKLERSFHLHLRESAIPVDGALELVRYLYQRYTLCIASNAPYRQQTLRLKKAGLYGYMKHIFVSEAIGFSKPSREFFEYCLKALSPLTPDEIMVIGDSLTADINGAAAFGLKSCYFNRCGTDVKSPADYTVAGLDEIKNFL